MEKNGGFSEMWSVVCNKVGGFFKALGSKIVGIFRRSQPSGEECDLQEAAEMPAEEAPAQEKPVTALGKVGKVLKTIGIWLYRLRKLFMAIPVIWCALRLAFYNLENLPEQVGINLLATGEYAMMIDRNLAVYGPLGVTAVCLVLMFCSHRARYPWVISIFTLVLPIVLLFTNLYPQ